MKKNKSLEILQKAKEELDEVTDEQGEEPEEDQLEKSFDTALEALTSEKKKSKKTLKKSEEDDEADDDADEGDDDASDDDDDDDAGEEAEVEEPVEEVQKSKKSKSFKQTFKETASREANEVLNVEPFLKSIVDSIDKKFTALEKSISKRFGNTIDEIAEVQERQSEFLVSQGELVKSVYRAVDTYNKTPEDRKSQITVQERFAKSESASGAMDASEIRECLSKAIEAKEVTNAQIAKTESRLSKGLPASGDVEAILMKYRKASDED